MSNFYDYIPHTDLDIKEMLNSLKCDSVDDLFKDVPDSIRLKNFLELPQPLSEGELLPELHRISLENITVNRSVSFLGGGAYHHFVPSAVRHLIFRSEFYTAYTPYQAEASQGTLQAIYEFQSLICHLTGMEAATASHYDGATALAEGVLMAMGETGRDEVVVSRCVNPEYKTVLSTYIKPRKKIIKEIPVLDGVTDLGALQKLISPNTAALVVQYPNFFGNIEELVDLAKAANKAGALFIVALGDPVALGCLESPGAFGADIVTGEGQPLGIPLSFGGPYVGFIASRNKLVRRLPGRIAGMTNDLEGKRAFVLTLQAREQHIRREKSSSNICTNEGLCALAVTVFLSLLGPAGLREMGDLCYQKAHYAYNQFTAIPGVKPLFASPFFHEFALQFPVSLEGLCFPDGRPVFLGSKLDSHFPEYPGSRLLCVTETMSRKVIDETAAIVKQHLIKGVVPA